MHFFDLVMIYRLIPSTLKHHELSVSLIKPKLSMLASYFVYSTTQIDISDSRELKK